MFRADYVRAVQQGSSGGWASSRLGLVRFAYVAVISAFAALRLLRMAEREKDVP
jgi:hypothetical protein